MPRPNSLEERIALIEDYIEIQQLIASYGPAADSCHLDEIRSIWTTDGIYDARGLAYLEGEEVIAAFDHDYHRSLVSAGSAHSSTMPHVVLDGDRASATNYSALYRHVDGKYELVRLNACRILLKRTDDGWRIYRRTNRLADGAGPAVDLLKMVRKPPSDAEVIPF